MLWVVVGFSVFCVLAERDPVGLHDRRVMFWRVLNQPPFPQFVEDRPGPAFLDAQRCRKTARTEFEPTARAGMTKENQQCGAVRNFVSRQGWKHYVAKVVKLLEPL